MNLSIFQPEAAHPATFNFCNHPVRCLERDGALWLVASDVCKALGLGNPSLAVNGNPSRPERGGLDEDEKGVFTLRTAGGPQKLLMVSEGGAYHLVFRSRRPEAERFQEWVCGEVLPSIRRTGGYTMPGAAAATAPLTFAEALRAAADRESKRELMASRV